MTRIFTGLAVIESLALFASFALGTLSKLRGASQDPNDPTYMIHIVLGLFTVIGALLVHCLIFTYFLGTGRWVKEVGLAYRLPDEPLPRLTRELKRWTFPPALFAMLISIATAAAGAAAQRREWPWEVHATLASLTLLINLGAFRVEYRNLKTNGEVLEQVLAEVDRIRASYGLPSNAEQLRQEERASFSDASEKRR